jgi:hypothetical protein
MEVASLQQPTLQANDVANAMDTSMDIDMDIDLGPLPEPELIEAVSPGVEVSVSGDPVLILRETGSSRTSRHCGRWHCRSRYGRSAVRKGSRPRGG